MLQSAIRGNLRNTLSPVAVVLASLALQASECVEVSQHDAFRYATLVFRGTVIRINDVTEQDDISSDKVPMIRVQSEDPKMVTFAVTGIWKGPLYDKIRVLAFGHPSQGVGYHFLWKGEYVVYTLGEIGQNWPALRRVAGNHPVFDIGMCPMRVVTNVRREVSRLGAAMAPVESRKK